MRIKINWDALGVGTSLACAIHCALLPLFLNSLPLLGVNLIDHLGFEIFMIALAFGVGAWSLYHGYSKHNHNFLPLTIFTIGFICLILKQFFVEYENWLLIPAVLLIVSAHILNFRYCRVHNHAHKDDCAH